MRGRVCGTVRFDHQPRANHVGRCRDGHSSGSVSQAPKYTKSDSITTRLIKDQGRNRPESKPETCFQSGLRAAYGSYVLYTEGCICVCPSLLLPPKFRPRPRIRPADAWAVLYF